GERGPVDRDARAERDMARTVDRVARGLEGVADDGMVDALRLDTRATERFGRGDRPELVRGHVLENAVVLAHSGPTAAEKQNLFPHDSSLHEPDTHGVRPQCAAPR